jgi:ubiquinol-cytochrome c reductase cytochrome b subunit
MSLQRRDRDRVLHGSESGRVVRTAEGRFFEVHEPLPEQERWTLVQYETPEPVQLTARVDANGVRRKSTRRERLRARLSGFYFADGIQPVTPAELAAAHHDGSTREAIEAEQASVESGADGQEWVGQLHGGADTRPETDAYAGHDDEANPVKP